MHRRQRSMRGRQRVRFGRPTHRHVPHDCIPTGWKALRYEECEIGCWLRSESECEEDERCTPIVDATNTYHECSVRRACADAPLCAYDGDSRYALFTTACLPNGWSYAPSSKCEGDAGE